MTRPGTQAVPIQGADDSWYIPYTGLDPEDIRRKLIDLAVSVRLNAYAPYSGILVGATIHSAEGGIYTGCNCETVTLTQTLHAEDNARGSMIAEGDRKIVQVAVAVAPHGEHFDLERTPPMPESLTIRDFPPSCGQCLQIILEHTGNDPEVELIFVTTDGGVYTTTMATALPMPFMIDLPGAQAPEAPEAPA